MTETIDLTITPTQPIELILESRLGITGPTGPPGPPGEDSVDLFADYLFNVKRFGAVGNGAVDDTLAFQDAVNEAAGRLVYAPPGEYWVEQVESAQDFVQPWIKGAGPWATFIVSQPGQAAFRLVGGSGTINGGGVSDLTIMGDGYGVELDGSCGMTVERVRFNPTLEEGLRFLNGISGAFTEMSIARNCEFLCRRAIHYCRALGTDSFHGSGFRDCAFGVPDAGTEPMILIDDNCNVYNAPWDGHIIQAVSTVSPIKSLTDAGYMPRTFGNLRFEGNGTPFLLVDPASTTPVFYTGQVQCLGDAFKLGSTFKLCTRISTYDDGSFDRICLPYDQQFAAVTGTTDISDTLESGDYLVQVDLLGADYIYSYLLSVHRSSFGVYGTVIVLANGEAYNVAAWGAPTFDVESSKLRITNATAGFDVTVRTRVTEMLNGLSNLQ